jgi:hypothetical protein
MAKDFFDQDLVEARSARSAPPPAAPDTGASSDDTAARTISDLNLTRMAKYREQRVAQQAESAKVLEALRRRTEEVDRERRMLDEETRQVDRFEQSRRDILEKLDQTLVMLEKHEMQAIRLTELYAGTKHRFQTLQQEVKAIQDSQWDEPRIREEVNRALVVIDDAKKEYGKAMARLEAAETGGSGGEMAVSMAAGAPPAEVRDFPDWVRTGFAFFLPLMAFLLVLGVVITAVMVSRS